MIVSKGGDGVKSRIWKVCVMCCLCMTLFTGCIGEDSSNILSEGTRRETGASQTRMSQSEVTSSRSNVTSPSMPMNEAPDSPFQNGELTRLTLYTKKEGDMFSAEIVQQGSITDSEQLQAIQQWLLQDEWRYYPTTESGWVKCQPVYARRVLIFETGQGRQIILHIPYDGSPYVAAGEFDADETYAGIFRAAIQGDASGEMFRRYTVSQSLVDELCRLYETAA